ncbi:MAG TPA: alpha/beta hydrolase [Nitrososphaeraceae archaeon]|nr:alpha/beta hydrolase [Nitrososphaeraceae archaeon]
MMIRYLESENSNESNRKHILFIHGLGSSAERWLDIPEALSLYFHTVALDLPGFGGSDKPSNMEYTIEAFSDIITEFMDKIGIGQRDDGSNDGRTTLIGHSLGGYIASSIAAGANNSEFLEKLVLVDSSGNLEKPTPLLDEYLDAAMNPSKEKVRKVFEQMVANPLLIGDALVQGFIYRISNPDSKYAFESSLRNSANTQIGIKNLNKIGEKGIPTLIIWGMHDKVIPTEHSQIFKEAIMDSYVTIIPRTGHAPFTEKPALVCEHLHKFLAHK